MGSSDSKFRYARIHFPLSMLDVFKIHPNIKVYNVLPHFGTVYLTREEFFNQLKRNGDWRIPGNKTITVEMDWEYFNLKKKLNYGQNFETDQKRFIQELDNGRSRRIKKGDLNKALGFDRDSFGEPILRGISHRAG